MTFCGNCGSQVVDNSRFCGNCGKPTVLQQLPVCSGCGAQIQEGLRFCPNCGKQYGHQPMQSNVNVTTLTPTNKPETEEEEVEYYRGEGQLIIKRTEHRGAARKVMGIAAGLATFGVGYIVIGKDKTRKSKAEGLIVISNKAIYVSGNDYPFDRIISLTTQGTISKSIVITFENDVQAGGRGGGSIAGTGGLSIEAEIKTKDIDNLYRALEKAKLAKVKRKVG